MPTYCILPFYPLSPYFLVEGHPPPSLSYSGSIIFVALSMKPVVITDNGTFFFSASTYFYKTRMKCNQLFQ